MRKSFIIFPPPYIVKKINHIFAKVLKYLSKTTFYQIFDCISLQVLDRGSLQIFANPCKFTSQLCQNKYSPSSEPSRRTFLLLLDAMYTTDPHHRSKSYSTPWAAPFHFFLHDRSYLLFLKFDLFPYTTIQD